MTEFLELAVLIAFVVVVTASLIVGASHLATAGEPVPPREVVRDGSSGLSGADDRHRAPGAVDHGVADGAQQQPLERPPAAGADHQETRVG